MQIRCQNCHRPFALSREGVYAALDSLNQEGLSYYNVHCPHCRRVNRISQEKLIHAAPDWNPEGENKGESVG